MRKTETTLRVVGAFLANPDSRQWGYELCQSTGIRSGSLYPVLTRLLDAEWIADGWEDPTEISGRPPRRYYTLTDLGRSEMGAFRAVAISEKRFSSPVLKPLGGTA